MAEKKVKIGVVGAGHLGKIHLRCLLQLPQYELVGFFDADQATAMRIADELAVSHYADYDTLLAAVDAIDIVTPTTTHFALAEKAIRAGKHLFIEKPVTQTPDEARQLLALQAHYPVKIQVGHVERFNPALLSIKDVPLRPMFIEAHRLSNFNPRGTDVSVVLDLMIHDLDLVLHLNPSPVARISASGVCIVSPTHDIVNARVEFANGCTANLTASRLSLKQMRKIRLFQNDAYISLDFLEKSAQIIRLYPDSHKPPLETLLPLETPQGTKWIEIAMPTPAPVNAIQMELATFHKAIIADEPVAVSLAEGSAALVLAYEIMAALPAQDTLTDTLK